jgi:phage shock protein PspC (stress-responsive transcriptional regulator)
MENNIRKLTRSLSDRRIAGVCGGLANYLNVDVTVIRILFLLALFFGGFGFWAYLIVWIAAPEENRLQP